MKKNPSSRAAPARSHRVDPVCGMAVKADSALRATHHGRTFHFCSRGCKHTFLHHPERYTAAAASQGESRRRSNDESGKGTREHAGRKRRWSDYLPLFVILAVALLAACAKQIAYLEEWDGRLWMHDFMGFFLLVFALLKLVNLSGFADGFQKYDLIAQRLRTYAFVYPFLELGLGLAYLAFWRSPWVYAVTILVLGFGAAGVIRALRRKLDVNCACLGTILNVPLSTVALVEDLGMAAMAAAMWLA